MRLSVIQRRTLEALAEAVLPEGGGLAPGAQSTHLADRVEAHILASEPRPRSIARLMLTAFGLSSLATRWARPFHLLPPEARIAYLHLCELSRIRQRRETLLALKALLLMHYCADPAVAALLGYEGKPRLPVRRPAAAEPVAVEKPKLPLRENCDVVIAGAGAGGAVCARELAAAGLSVLVLEEGERFTRDDFQGPFPDRLRRLYRDAGLTFTVGAPVISLPMGRGVGGSTLINSGTCFRAPEWVLKRWGEDPEGMAPYFEDVERTLRVAPVPARTMGANGELTLAGAAALGYSHGPLQRNAPDCHGHGMCAFGCPIDAKLGVHRNYLPAAVAAGARILPGLRVRRVIVEGGRAVGVAGDGFEVRARAVVLACGAVHSADLLLRNRLGGPSGQLGRNFRIHPGAGILGVFDRDLQPWVGVMQSAHVDERLRDGILLEATYPPPGVGYSAGGLPAVGPELKDLLAEYPRTAAIGLIVSDQGAGRVRAAPGGPLMLYSLSAPDVQRMLEAIAVASEVLLAAGAREVHTLLPGLPPVRSRDQLRQIRESRWRAGDLKLSAYHPMGTARLGDDPRTSVVDRFGALHHLPGLVVADASILPGSTYVNPQITIMALATRAARHLAEALVRA